MQVLKIQEDKREELTNSGIVICTYKLINGDEVDAIELIHLDLYPDFEIVEVRDEIY